MGWVGGIRLLGQSPKKVFEPSRIQMLKTRTNQLTLHTIIQSRKETYSFELVLVVFLREYNKIFDKIRRADMNTIVKLTQCIKPCKYKKYSFLGDRKPSLFKSDYAAFSLWAVSENTRVATEQLVYPVSSLIAEFGGSLSLFLGVSFVTLWDNCHLFAVVCRIVFNQERSLQI